MPQLAAITLVPIIPAWLIAALAAALLLLLAQGSLILLKKRVPRNWVAIFGVLRVVIIAVLVLGLLQPVVSFSKTVDRLPDLLMMVDASQSMGIKGTNGTRLEDAMETARKSGLTAELARHYNLRWFTFDRSAYPMDESDLAGIKPTGDTTRYAESLTAAWNYQRQAEAPGAGQVARAPARAVLISDGNDLGRDDVVEAAQKLGVVVDTFAPGKAGPNQAANKVVLTGVQSARRVLIGSETEILATLRADGNVTGPVSLSLIENDKPIIVQEVTFNPGQSEKQVRLFHRPTDIGLHQYQLQLKGPGNAPTPPPYKYSSRVVDNKKEVLILEDTWRWEFKYLRRMLEDDPSFSLTAMLARGGSSYAQFGEADRRVNLGGFPQGRGELEWFDVIVLGDVNPASWPSGLARAIHDVVTDEGKSLVILAGPNLAKIAEVPEIASLLPVEITRESATPIEGPIDVRISREGATSPFFFQVPTQGGLPPLDRIYPPLRKKPAATILVESATQANAYGNLIVMAEHTVGKGRVLYIGTDTLWKWQMSGPESDAGVTPYVVFWQQALRALAPLQSHAPGVNLTLQPDRSRYEAGRRVTFRAEIKSDRPLVSPTLEGVVTLPDEKQVPLSFTPDPTKANTYQAELEPTTAGQYKIAATVTIGGKPAADVLAAINVEEPRAELSSTRIDDANLARIAAGTGGKVIDPADPKTWPAGDKAATLQVKQDTHIDLWNNMTLMLVLCALLGTDWLLRLLRGYV